MSTCTVSIGGYCDDGAAAEFHNTTKHKCRKPFRCHECNREVETGELYQYDRGKFDGDFYDFKTCLPCAEIRDAFDEGGATGELWEEMSDHGFEYMTTACFDQLETAKAKAFLRDKWMEWKGLRGQA
jgi:hypothetical protein